MYNVGVFLFSIQLNESSVGVFLFSIQLNESSVGVFLFSIQLNESSVGVFLLSELPIAPPVSRRHYVACKFETHHFSALSYILHLTLSHTITHELSYTPPM